MKFKIDWEATLGYWAGIAVVVIIGQIWIPEISILEIVKMMIGQLGTFFLFAGICSNCRRYSNVVFTRKHLQRSPTPSLS